MTENWMTIEQAAVALGLSVRTVNRHINAGKLQSRLTDGRREVLLDAAAPIPGAAGQVAATASTVNVPGDIVGVEADSNHDTNVVDYETVLALADNAADKAELAVTAYQTLARSADDRARSNRRFSYAAWSLVAGMAVASIVSVGWTSSTLTRAAAEQEHLESQVIQATALADSTADECDDLRKALLRAREDAARSEGQLAVYRDNETRRTTATTRPTLAERIASILDE